MAKERMSHEEYLAVIEVLAKQVIHEAIEANEFEVFADGDGAKTPLQLSITILARVLRYTHEHGDGCFHDE